MEPLGATARAFRDRRDSPRSAWDLAQATQARQPATLATSSFQQIDVARELSSPHAGRAVAGATSPVIGETMVDASFATKEDLDRKLDELRVELRDEVRGVAVLVERNGSDMRAMLEGMSSMRDELTRQMTDMEERLSSRIEALEGVVRSHSLDIRKSSEDLRALTTEVAALRIRFDRRDVQLEELEERVAATEKRLGIKG
ncbi:MAG TPA: hypothetical protein VLM85_23710 [Polyangiaceae bacterium]|nr:hypothetical protein [Polyangiaceae bacterium]